jgi:hypothetical protein
MRINLFVIPGLSEAENPEPRGNRLTTECLPLDSGSRFARPE